MLESLYQTADAGVSISDSGCRSLNIRQLMHETLYNIQRMKKSSYQTADARLFIRQWMQETLYNRQRMQLSLYQTENAGVSKLDPGVYRADLYTQSRA